MKELCIFIVVFGFSVSGADAAHPLITDDTGTQGEGNYQLEFTGEYARRNADGILTESLVVPTVPGISYGITDRTDLVLGISYLHQRTKGQADTTKADGISDLSIEIKHRCSEKNGVSLALKSGVTLPTGDDRKGLGTGRITGHLIFIMSKELDPWAFHLNLGYVRNENTRDERRDLWLVSWASEFKAGNGLKAVANIGMARNPDKSSDKYPAFVLGGLIYSITRNFDMDLGLKRGLNTPGTDYSVLAGIAWRL
ncbi:MAG: transporter [Thermodesulfovibrionales bacterium]